MLSAGASSFNMLNGHSPAHTADNLPGDAVNRLSHYLQVDNERQNFNHVGGPPPLSSRFNQADVILVEHDQED